MITFNQLSKKKRSKKTHYNFSNQLQKCPQLKGVCNKVYTVTPKKPNSAIRKVTKVKLTTGYSIIAYIPGQGHNLQEHSTVLIRGGKIPDLPGIHYRTIRGKNDFDATEVFARSNMRSKFGIKKVKK